jgi:hypothetical protein
MGTFTVPGIPFTGSPLGKRWGTPWRTDNLLCKRYLSHSAHADARPSCQLRRMQRADGMGDKVRVGRELEITQLLSFPGNLVAIASLC